MIALTRLILSGLPLGPIEDESISVWQSKTKKIHFRRTCTTLRSEPEPRKLTLLAMNELELCSRCAMQAPTLTTREYLAAAADTQRFTPGNALTQLREGSGKEPWNIIESLCDSVRTVEENLRRAPDSVRPLWAARLELCQRDVAEAGALVLAREGAEGLCVRAAVALTTTSNQVTQCLNSAGMQTLMNDPNGRMDPGAWLLRQWRQLIARHGNFSVAGEALVTDGREWAGDTPALVSQLPELPLTRGSETSSNAWLTHAWQVARDEALARALSRLRERAEAELGKHEELEVVVLRPSRNHWERERSDELLSTVAVRQRYLSASHTPESVSYYVVPGVVGAWMASPGDRYASATRGERLGTLSELGLDAWLSAQGSEPASAQPRLLRQLLLTASELSVNAELDAATALMTARHSLTQ